LIPYGGCCVKAVAGRGRWVCSGLCDGLDTGGNLRPVLLVVMAGKGLAEPAAEVSEVFDQPPGGAVGVEVVVVGEAGQLAEDVVGGVQQPVFEDLGVAEEFAQVVGLVLGEGDRLGGHGGLRFGAGWDGPPAGSRQAAL
jgi:hypothetical protein